VLHLVLMEAAVVSCLAGIMGYLVGILATLATLPLLDGGQAIWHWNPALAVAAITAALIVGLVASLQPAMRASRLEPSEALRAF
jgi:putative ABC transport system permease protein